MSVYRRGNTHWIKIQGPDGLLRRLPALKSKRSSEEMERKLNALKAGRLAGELPEAGLLRWLETLPMVTMARLVEYGFLDARRGAVAQPLLVITKNKKKETVTGGHLFDWQRHLEAKGDCRRHVRQEIAKLVRVIRGCGWAFLGDLRADGLLALLDTLTNAEGGPLSTRTRNSIVGAVKTFGAWLVRERRVQENPFSHLSRKNVRLDRRLIRRPYSPEELTRLVTAAEYGPKFQKITGPERALVYLLAADTGLRKSEIGSLIHASFDFDSVPATVTVQAAHSKNRREDTLPLRSALAERLKKALAHRRPDDPAFPLPKDGYVAKMLRHDLEATADPEKGLEAIPYVGAAGRVADFHSLRHTFITNLVNSGAHPKVAQDLARHSDVNITLGVYTHTKMEKRAEAVDRLPEIKPPDDSVDNADGDDDFGYAVLSA